MERGGLVLLFLICLYCNSQETLLKFNKLDDIVLTGQYLPIHIDSSIYVVDIISNKELHNFGAQNLF